MPDDDVRSRCPEPEELLLFHYGELDAVQQGRLQTHLSTCAPCGKVLIDLRETLKTFGQLDVEAPGETRLAAMIEEAALRPGPEQPRDDVPPVLQGRSSGPPVSWWVAASIVLLVLAAVLTVTRWESPSSPSLPAALQAPSANDRLRAVVESGRLQTASPELLAGLIQVLRTDASVNVRLAVIDTLRGHPGSRDHREALIAALADQPPLTRKALIELLVALDLTAARPVLQEMAGSDPSAAVRARARWALQELS